MKSINIVFVLLMVLAIAGCATWKGVKTDALDGYDWSKKQVNHGAGYVEEKTDGK